MKDKSDKLWGEEQRLSFDKSLLGNTLSGSYYALRSNYTVNLFRPFARRLFKTARPSAVCMR